MTGSISDLNIKPQESVRTPIMIDGPGGTKIPSGESQIVQFIGFTRSGEVFVAPPLKERRVIEIYIRGSGDTRFLKLGEELGENEVLGSTVHSRYSRFERIES